MNDLARKAVRGTLAVAAANAVTRIVGLAGTVYLMAMVSPRQFGMVGYAVALLTICSSLTNWGYTHAAVHRQERVDETFSTGLVLRLATLAALFCIVGVGALALRGELEARTHLGALGVLAVAALVDAGCEAPLARLGRALRFGGMAAVDVASTVIATAVGVILAALGFGLWALVANRASHSLVRAVALGLLSVEPTRLRFHLEDARWLLRFSMPLWLGGLATMWLLKYDDLVVGSLRDSETLGHYDRAYALALLPLAMVTGVLTRVSFPLYARLQNDRRRLSEAFRIASGTALRLSAPLAVAAAVVIPDFLAVMGWRQWEPMAPMFRWLLVYAMVRPLMDDAGGLLTAIGHPRITGHTLVAEAGALLVLCPLLTSRWGAEGAAASVGLIVLVGLLVWYFVFLPRFVDLSYRRMLLWPVISVGASAAAGLAVARWGGLGVGLAGGAAKLAAMAVVYVVAMLVLDGRQTLADLRTLRRHAFGDRTGNG